MSPRQTLQSLCAGVAVELVCVALMSRHGNFLESGESSKFTAFAISAGIGFWFAVCNFTGVTATGKTHALWFWIVAVALRLAILPVSPGDDVWRYRWEGSVQLHGFNPYQLAPDSAALAGWRDADWSRINHRDVPAIYPPLSEGMFAVLALGGNSILAYKILFACADLAAAAILRRLLADSGKSPGWAAWYAWNPLAVYISAGAAHFDVMMVLPMIGAVWCLQRLSALPVQHGDASSWRVPPLAWTSAGLLGVAIAFKAVPAVLLPVWFFALGWRRSAVTLPLAVGLTPALAMLYGFPRTPVFATLGRFASGFQVNNAFWWIVDPADRWSRWYGIIVVGVCLALAFWLGRDWRRATLWVMGAALLLSPALHAWYVLWVLPLAVWRGEHAQPWVVLSISVFGYFLLWEVNNGSGKDWIEPLWLRLLIYLPPLVSLGRWLTVRPSGHADAA